MKQPKRKMEKMTTKMERLPPLRAAAEAGFMEKEAAAAERSAGENLRRREGCMMTPTRI